jgi:hypothetical protein
VLLNDEARVFGGFHARLAIASRESLPAAMTSGQQGPGMHVPSAGLAPARCRKIRPRSWNLREIHPFSAGKEPTMLNCAFPH